MIARARSRLVAIALATGASVLACSGARPDANDNGGPDVGPNAVAVTVDPGPSGAQGGYVNGLFTTVTVCLPDDARNCHTIDGILVDTGSTGLRVLSSALALSLPAERTDDGQTIANCYPFEDGSYVFGPVVRADVRMASERASTLPIQLVVDPASTTFPKPPGACSNGGGTNEGTIDTLGANGILGLDFYRQDCGTDCVADSSPGLYFACSATECQPTKMDLAYQVANPVAAFATDNNGVVVSLPPIDANGTTAVTGTLTFGIGTTANNGLGDSLALRPASDGTIVTQFRGQSFPSSAIDTGSNAIFFSSASMSGLSTCRVNTDFYCSVPALDLSASLVGNDGASGSVAFSVANADSLLAGDNAAFDDIAGPNAPLVGFLWGLPFFYNRRVFTVFEGATTAAGSGPFWAYTP